MTEGNWLTNPACWDLCDRHETTFPMHDDDGCPECYREKTGHYPRCGVYEGTQQGPCSCSTHTSTPEHP